MKADGPSLIYDRELALRVAGNRPEIADHLLALLIHKDLPLQEQGLRDAYRHQRLDELREISHKLQGSARYCGTPALQAAAQCLESLLTGASGSTAVSDGYHRLLNEIRRLRETFHTLDG